MKCPVCGFTDSKVVDSRHMEESNGIKRRRECLACGKRYSTYEYVETSQIFVVKKDGSREFFERGKLLSGIVKACQKRPVNPEAIVNEIELELQNSLCNEISTKELGEMVMDKLKVQDDVAYVRFASVYREFKDIATFMEELDKLKKDE